jgi:hypothetical protein
MSLGDYEMAYAFDLRPTTSEPWGVYQIEAEDRPMNDPQSHWQDVWTSRAPDEVSWFELEPST